MSEQASTPLGVVTVRMRRRHQWRFEHGYFDSEADLSRPAALLGSAAGINLHTVVVTRSYIGAVAAFGSRRLSVSDCQREMLAAHAACGGPEGA
jgi:hypothetical protein